MRHFTTSDRTRLPAWQALKDHQQHMRAFSLASEFKQNPHRFADFSLRHEGLLFDFSKNLITAQSLELLEQLAHECGLATAIEAMFAGEAINYTEQRPALHIALREPAQSQREEVKLAQQRMALLVEQVRSGSWLGYTGKRITDIVNIGIGGSFLGPQLAVQALEPFVTPDLRCHFLANIDSSSFYQLSRDIHPETTLFIVSSKSFGTLETLKNALAARQWFLNCGGKEHELRQHFIAVSSNISKAIEFGIAEENIFPMWDWVGGRYSVWSAIGLPVALMVGMQGFHQMLAGAHSMDNHFRHTPFQNNIPVIMALLGVWYNNFWGACSQAVLPYDNYLRSLPDYLQQLDMESNGKSVNANGAALDYHSGGILWGNIGTNGQHAYHQLLLQGTRLIPADFIIAARSQNPIVDHQQWLLANCFSQSQALMCGKSLATAEQELQQKGFSDDEVKRLAPHLVIPGNRPSNTLILEQLNPFNLGALIALYEHKIYTQSIIWDINAFDQWAVELGKQLGTHIYQQLSATESCDSLDSSTAGLVRFCQQTNHS